MSRKREHQRETKKELARQLGVRGKDVPTDLLAHERVCEPTLAIKELIVTRARRAGLWSKVGLTARHDVSVTIDAALWCVSEVTRAGGELHAGQIRAVRSGRAQATLVDGALGQATLVPGAASDHGLDVVRYKRPGAFVVALAVFVDAAPTSSLAEAAALDVDGAPRALASLAASPGQAVRWPGAAAARVVAFAAADRVKEVLTVSFATPAAAGDVVVAVRA